MFLSDRSSPLLLTLIVEKRDIEHGGGRGGVRRFGGFCSEVLANCSMLFLLLLIEFAASEVGPGC